MTDSTPARTNRDRWTCPGCGRLFRLPAGRTPPQVCQQCRDLVAQPQAEIEPETPPAAASAPAASVHLWRQLSFRDRLMAGLCAGLLLILLPWQIWVISFSPHTPAPVSADAAAIQQAAAERTRPIEERFPRDVDGVPTDAEVVERLELFLKSTLREKAAIIVNNIEAVRRFDALLPDSCRWQITGAIPAEGQPDPWSLDLSWERDTDQFEFELIILKNHVIFLSERAKAEDARHTRFVQKAAGNSISSLPADIAREIRNVAAAVDDALRTKLRQAYVPQWPDDPGRNEFEIFYQHDDEHWVVRGKVETFDSAPRRDIEAHVSPDFTVRRLRIAKRWVIGAAPVVE